MQLLFPVRISLPDGGIKSDVELIGRSELPETEYGASVRTKRTLDFPNNYVDGTSVFTSDKHQHFYFAALRRESNDSLFVELAQIDTMCGMTWSRFLGPRPKESRPMVLTRHNGVFLITSELDSFRIDGKPCNKVRVRAVTVQGEELYMKDLSHTAFVGAGITVDGLAIAGVDVTQTWSAHASVWLWGNSGQTISGTPRFVHYGGVTGAAVVSRDTIAVYQYPNRVKMITRTGSSGLWEMWGQELRAIALRNSGLFVTAFDDTAHQIHFLHKWPDKILRKDSFQLANL